MLVTWRNVVARDTIKLVEYPPIDNVGIQHRQHEYHHVTAASTVHLTPGERCELSSTLQHTAADTVTVTQTQRQ